MAGHSKWNNIKNKKGAEDARRAQIFTNLVKNIRLAAKNGGDITSNANLRLWVEKAKEANMPKDKIQKAIDLGSGKLSAGNLQEINYEGFGPGGVALIISALTDNTNRTSSEIRALLSRAGGSLGSPGCASFMFNFDKNKQEFVATIILEVDAEIKTKIETLKADLAQIEEIEAIYTNII